MFETGAKRWVVWLTRCKFYRMLTITRACVDVLSAHTVKTHKKQNPPCLPKAQTFYSLCARDRCKKEKKYNNKNQIILDTWFPKHFWNVGCGLFSCTFLWELDIPISLFTSLWTLGKKNITQMGCSQNWRKPLHCIETRFFFGLC